MHRVQRIPPGETRRHTCTVTVAVLDGRHAERVVLDPDDVRIECYRAPGPGGQHRNTTDSAVRLTHEPTGIVVCAAQSRSQHTNRTTAWAELQRRLECHAVHRASRDLQRARSAQIGRGERPEVTWTWNDQRGQVTHHPTGRRWRWRDLTRGRF